MTVATGAIGRMNPSAPVAAKQMRSKRTRSAVTNRLNYLLVVRRHLIPIRFAVSGAIVSEDLLNAIHPIALPSSD